MSKKKSNYTVKKCPWKFYDARIDPELIAAWASDQELEEGYLKQCWPNDKYPHPLLVDQMLDRMWAENGGEPQFAPGNDCLVIQWDDPEGEIVPLRFIIYPAEKIIHVDIMTPEAQAFTDDTTDASPNPALKGQHI